MKKPFDLFDVVLITTPKFKHEIKTDDKQNIFLYGL